MAIREFDGHEVRIMRWSVCATGFKDFSIEEVIRWLEPWNSLIHGLELWAGHIESFQTNHGPLDKLAKLLAGHGYCVPSVSGYTKFSGSAADVENDLKQFIRLLDVSRQLGSPMVRTFAGHVGSRHASPEMWMETVAALRKAVQAADMYEVNVAIEMHYDSFADDAEPIEQLFEDLAHPPAVLIYDSANLNADRLDPVSVLERTMSRVRHVHLKNYRWNHDNRYRSEPVPVFDGDVDNRAVLRILQEKGFDGFVSLEYFGEKGRPNLAKSLEQIRSWRNSH